MHQTHSSSFDRGLNHVVGEPIKKAHCKRLAFLVELPVEKLRKRRHFERWPFAWKLSSFVWLLQGHPGSRGSLLGETETRGEKEGPLVSFASQRACAWNQGNSGFVQNLKVLLNLKTKIQCLEVHEFLVKVVQFVLL